MHFGSPIFLLGLVPFAALVVYLLRGRPNRQDVPFLKLWRGPVEPPRVARAVRRPPLPLAVALGAVLCAILAAGRPMVHPPWGVARGNAVTVIVDRGITMSARGTSTYRFREVGREVGPALSTRVFRTPVHVVRVPADETSPEHTEGWDVSGPLEAIDPVAVETFSALIATVSRCLRETSGPVVVLTDQTIPVEDERLVVVTPAPAGGNVGIALLAFRETPRRQLMVRVRNDSANQQVELVVYGNDDEVLRTTLDLPAEGSMRDYFVDLDKTSNVITVMLRPDDALRFDNSASLVRKHALPRIEVRAGISAELQRLVEQFGRVNPAAESSPRVAVVGEDTVTSEAAVFVASPPTNASGGDVQVVDHPVTRALADLSSFKDVRVAEAPSEASWQPVLRIGGKVAVAVRKTPARQAWVGFASEAFPTTPEFVILWTTLFNWAGGTGETSFVAEEVRAVGPEWKRVDGRDVKLEPGLYTRADGAMLALNAPSPTFPTVTRTDWESRLDALAARHVRDTASYPLSRPLLLVSLLLLVVAAWKWNRPITHGSNTSDVEEFSDLMNAQERR